MFKQIDNFRARLRIARTEEHVSRFIAACGVCATTPGVWWPSLTRDEVAMLLDRNSTWASVVIEADAHIFAVVYGLDIEGVWTRVVLGFRGLVPAAVDPTTVIAVLEEKRSMLELIYGVRLPPLDA